MKINFQDGMSLLEVLFAVSFFGIMSVGILPAFLGHYKEITNNDHRLNSIALAQELLDELRTENPTNMPEDGADAPVTFPRGNYTYTAVVSYCERLEFCTSDDIRHITVRINHQDREFYHIETVFAALR
jgi:type II secretory pathway pseudopilin PulG